MANRISDRMVKAFERFNADLKAFGEETGETFVTLYEDAFTTRRVANFRLYKNGNLKDRDYETLDVSNGECASDGITYKIDGRVVEIIDE